MAALIPLSTPAFEPEYEARGYALMVACTAGALAAWQRRTEGSRFGLVLLAAALGGGVWARYYGLLVFARSRSANSSAPVRHEACLRRWPLH